MPATNRLKYLYTSTRLQPGNGSGTARDGPESLGNTRSLRVYKANVQCLKILYYRRKEQGVREGQEVRSLSEPKTFERTGNNGNIAGRNQTSRGPLALGGAADSDAQDGGCIDRAFLL